MENDGKSVARSRQKEEAQTGAVLAVVRPGKNKIDQSPSLRSVSQCCYRPAWNNIFGGEAFQRELCLAGPLGCSYSARAMSGHKERKPTGPNMCPSSTDRRVRLTSKGKVRARKLNAFRAQKLKLLISDRDIRS